MAAAPKSISGTAVMMPVVVKRAAWPMPWEPKLDAPVDTSHRTYASANGVSTTVSTVMLSTAPTLACFLSRP